MIVTSWENNFLTSIDTGIATYSKTAYAIDFFTTSLDYLGIKPDLHSMHQKNKHLGSNTYINKIIIQY